MKLDVDHADQVLRVLTGKLRPRPALSDLVRRLDSNEEFLAWLLATEGVLGDEPELTARLRELARVQQIAPATRRVASDYPMVLEESRRKLSADITALLDAHCAPAAIEESLHTDRVQFAQASPPGGAPLRDLLAIRNAPTPR